MRDTEWKPFLCSGCKLPIGVSTALCLVIGGVRHTQSTSFFCMVCDKKTRWYPSPLDKTDARTDNAR